MYADILQLLMSEEEGRARRTGRREGENRRAADGGVWWTMKRAEGFIIPVFQDRWG